MHCPEIGDCIGVESSAALKSDIDAPPRLGGVTSRRRRRLEATPAASKEYPPPISWLARTENLPSHMPWVMRKYYSGDGRLIIKEERVKHHDYFLADRSNGRLVLSLVHLDDAVEESCKECHAAERVVERFSGDGGDEGCGGPTVEEEVATRSAICGGPTVEEEVATRSAISIMV